MLSSFLPLLADRATFNTAVRRYLQAQAGDAIDLFGEHVETVLHAIAAADGRGDAPAELLKCPAWAELADLFEYAVEGIEPPDGAPIRRDFYDVFQGRGGTSTLEEHIEQVYVLASARHVLDGGNRDFFPFEDVPAGYLSVLEVALLARMEPRSVRNAMHPKLADRLVGEQHGSRTFISVPEARRWLSGRRGFMATTKSGAEPKERLSTVALPEGLVTQIVMAAASEGVSVESLVARCLTASARQS